MKKFIALALALAAGTAFAGGFGSITYGNNDGVNGEANSKSYKVTAGFDLTDAIKVDVSNQLKAADSTTDNGNRLEAGVTYTQPIVAGLSGYGRVGLGQKYKSTGDFSYYSVEPGVKYAVNDALTWFVYKDDVYNDVEIDDVKYNAAVPLIDWETANSEELKA